MRPQFTIQFITPEALHAAADSREPVVLCIDKREILSGSIARPLDCLMTLSDSDRLTHAYADRLALVFTGYDDDPREVHQIPEIRAYFAQLNAQWSTWYHFVEKDGPTLGVILRLLATFVPQAGTRRGIYLSEELADPQAFRQMLMGLFTSMNRLYELHGIGLAQNMAMTDKVTHYVERMFLPL